MGRRLPIKTARKWSICFLAVAPLQKRIDGLEDKLRDVRCELHRLCGLAPWEQDVLDVLDPQPWPRTGDLYDASGPKVLAIQQAIEAALPRRKPVGASGAGAPS